MYMIHVCSCKGIVFDTNSETGCCRFAEICIRCPFFANEYLFGKGNRRLSKTDSIAVNDSSVRRLRSFRASNQRFIVFRFDFEFLNYTLI